MRCACNTATGSRCTRSATPESNFCKQHASCERTDAPINDERYQTRELTSALRATVAELVRERDHYLKKLEQVERFAQSLDPSARKRLLTLLHK